MNFFKKLSMGQFGFSLIELVVVIGIVATISSLSIASFSGFNNRQTLKTATTELVSQLHSAKSQALSQVKPQPCLNKTLEGYQISITVPGSVYKREVLCGGNMYTIETKKLPSNISFVTGSATQISFRVLSGTVSSPGSITITGYGQTQTITVTTTGTISVQ